MITSTTFVADKEITIVYATAIVSGYGHKKIAVEIKYNDNRKLFTDITSNMRAYDLAMELEGAEKNYALYQIIEHLLIDEIANWLEQLEESTND